MECLATRQQAATLPGVGQRTDLRSKESPENHRQYRRESKIASELHRYLCPRQDSNLRPSAPEAESFRPLASVGVFGGPV
jgi:hypothetical protein